jgi:hypothetical protein
MQKKDLRGKKFSSEISIQTLKHKYKMSSTSNNHYIQAETSTRIDACFGGVVVQSPGNKFQYFQDRNKRWPFTCSEKGCACFFFFCRRQFSLFLFLVKRARLVRVCVRRFARLVRRRLSTSSSSSREDDLVGGVSCFLFVLRARRIFLFFFSIVCLL